MTMILHSTAQIGWFLLGFGSIFFWQLVMQADYSAITDRSAVAHTRGVVTGVEETGEKESKKRVMANHYRFSVNDRAFTGTSYTTGNQVTPGSAVDVEYSPEDPSRSKIAGMRRKKFSAVVAAMTLIPLGGLFVLIRAMRGGARRAALLRDGILTTGKLEDTRATNMSYNRRRVYVLTFGFTARDGRKHSARVRTSDPSRWDDGAAKAVLYDPGNPDRAFLLDELPSRPELDDMGELRPRRARAMATLILPFIVIIGNVLAAA
jgi:hypothetical protein